MFTASNKQRTHCGDVVDDNGGESDDAKDGHEEMMLLYTFHALLFNHSQSAEHAYTCRVLHEALVPSSIKKHVINVQERYGLVFHVLVVSLISYQSTP